ncbi:PREDICTED: uncharacterized protein LOC104603029 isoform X2 [Nelumbo nucifera]|uniref:Uncharacterized protein LOC104603029 isoform X2 n=1 Tax=Nelumbo nucifera TaxID=4432 RepID=A0A1U8AQL6_NELNU|nr:PREDICTED: uncharacterized protein LOC104603029 isoform X2 [Nelumbo nucifera]XP_010265242.1 PREDICTED: uncharacterized protein LOC104603029 isoform X2 [Nelumbo nucifera]
MVTLACKLKLPNSDPSLEVTSLLFEPLSNSLALMHSDSSILLTSSPSLFSPSLSFSFPHQTLIPPNSTSACFLRLLPNPNSTDGRVLFVVAGPHNGGSSILLRFWILGKNQRFAKARVNCTQKSLDCGHRLGVVVDLSHGFSVKLSGSVNVFALHSISARKIWVFAAKTVGDADDGLGVNLMKCAIIDCTMPICSITVSFGFLLLGENNGVRVFPLRPLVKGRPSRQRELARRREHYQSGGLNGDVLKTGELHLQNEMIQTTNGSNDLSSTSVTYSKHGISDRNGKIAGLEGTSEIFANGYTIKTEVHRVSEKTRTLKLRQDACEGGSCFIAFKSLEVQSPQPMTVALLSLKAVSIHALSSKKFLVLDSAGDLHLLILYNVLGSEINGHMKHFNHTMKVQMLAVLPDISMRTQIVWVSDGYHSVHIISVSDMDIPINENGKADGIEKPIQISAIQAIFASEKIQDIALLAANAILILGQEHFSSKPA